MKRVPIRAVSRKRAALNRVRARLRAEMIGLPCEAHFDGCQRTGTDWHERRSRARGGSITDPANRVWLCRVCHSLITLNPAWAEEHGWSLSSYGGSHA